MRHLISSPRCGTLEAHLPTDVFLLRRSVFSTDAGIASLQPASASLYKQRLSGQRYRGNGVLEPNQGS